MKWSRASGIGVFLALAMPAWIALTGIGDRAFSQLLPDGVAAAMTIGWSLLALPVFGLWLYGRLFGNAASATSPASPPPSPFALHVDGDGVALRRKREPVGAVAWDDILGVDLFTTDEGPWAEDVYWVIHRREGGEPLIIPGGAEGVDALLAAVETRLPGFDMDAVIRAMGSTENARFALWQAPGAGA